jgi:aspartyl-tRNA(Asn)/glutamyl-tRNA(Gln) amidotransferase subunit B
LPLLPSIIKKEWKIKYALSDYDIEQLCENKEEAEFFVAFTAHTKLYKAAANWIIGPIRAYLNETNNTYSSLEKLIPYLVALLNLVEEQKINFSVASNKVFKAIVENPQSPLEFASANNLLQTNSLDEINTWIEEVLKNNPEKVIEYKKGKKGLMGLFIGEVKKISKGKADPKVATQLLEKELSK